jgi:hypothetical protein
MNQVNQATDAQIPLKLFSLGVAKRSFAIPFGEAINSANRIGPEFPFQDCLCDFRAKVTAIGGDHVCQDVGFGDLRGTAHR